MVCDITHMLIAEQWTLAWIVAILYICRLINSRQSTVKLVTERTHTRSCALNVHVRPHTLFIYLLFYLVLRFSCSGQSTLNWCTYWPYSSFRVHTFYVFGINIGLHRKYSRIVRQVRDKLSECEQIKRFKR